MATTRSTAGPGFDFEDQIGAHLLLRMLLGEPLPALGDATGSKLQTQTQALGWDIDDLLAISEPGSDTQRQLAISCKSSVQVTSSGLPSSFVLAAWKQWSIALQGPMSRERDHLMLVTRGRNDTFQPLWADIKNWCSGPDANLALARVLEPAAHRRIFESIKGPILEITPEATEAELIALIQHLEVMPTDFDLPASEDERKAIGQCRSLLVSGEVPEARKLWSELVNAVRNARLGHGTVELGRLWSDLRGTFALKDHPDYAPSWSALRTNTNGYKGHIETALPTGFSLARTTDVEALAPLIANESALVVFGESGTGKSALLKSTLDERFPTWSQIWVGPEELAVMLNEAERTKLGLGHSLQGVLKWAATSQIVLVIDAAERLTRDVQEKARALVAALLAHNRETGQTCCHVVIVGQTEAWADGRLQRIGNATLPAHHEVKPISGPDVKSALRSTQQLGWIASHEDVVEALTNLRALGWVMEAEGRLQPGDVSALVSQAAIADRLWNFWTEGQLRLQGLVMRLAEREANFEHSFAISELDPTDATIFESRPNQLPMVVTSRNRIEFQHDLAAEWARFQRLKEIADETERWASYATNPLWTGALRMLGGFLLREQVEGRAAWDIAFEAVRSLEGTTLAADVLLDALCLDPLAEQFLTERVELLFRQDGRVLTRLLKRFLHIATVPGGNSKVLAELLHGEPSYALYIEAQFRTPIIARWPAIARFLAAHQERVATLTSPVVATLCEKWLTTLPVEYAAGKPMPFRKEFAELALATARILQLEQNKSTMLVGEWGKSIFPAALAAAPDLPDEVSGWALEMVRRRPLSGDLADKIAEYRAEQSRVHAEKLASDPEYRAKQEQRRRAAVSISSRRQLPSWPLGPQGRMARDFRECCTHGNGLLALMKVRPETASEILLAVLIDDTPEEEYGSSPRLDDELGLAYDKQSYPTAYWKSPFFSFLQIDADQALDTLITLVNFCTERWVAECMRRSSHPPAKIVLTFSDGAGREFFGNHIVFDWSQSNSGRAGPLHSALAALERWLHIKIEGGADVAPYINRILQTGSSVSLLGVLVNIGKFRPTFFEGILRPLTASHHLYRWDDYRVDALSYSFVGGQWALQGDLIFNMARDWHNAPYRNEPFRKVASALVQANDELAVYVNEATAQWPVPDDDKQSLELRILAAELDSRNYNVGGQVSAGHNQAQFALPSNLMDDIQAFQNSKALARNILALPDRCRAVLAQRNRIEEGSVEALVATLESIDTEADLEEGFKSRARIALASTLAARAGDWLKLHPEAHNTVWSVLHTALDDIGDTASSQRGPYSERAGELEFATHAVFAWWLETADAAASLAVMKILTSGDDAAVQTLMVLAHGNRSTLGARWWRLLYLALLWSGLSVLRPRYGHGPEEGDLWARWLRWLRARSLSDATASPAQIAPVSIANRIEMLERARWTREFTRGEGRYGRSPEERRSSGLDWGVLKSAFGWLLADGSELTGTDEDEAEQRRELALALWSFEVWRTYRGRDEQEDDAPLSDLGYRVIETLARMTAKAPAASAQALWEPVFTLGAAGHYAVEHFLLCWFMETARTDPSSFALRWKSMIEYGLASPRWGEGTPWFYGQRLLRHVLGFGSESTLDRNIAFQQIVQNMRGLYEQWARKHLTVEEDNIAALCTFLGSATGRSLRLDGLQWLDRAISSESPPETWYRPSTGAALVDLLNVVISEDLAALLANVTARTALLTLAALLVARQIPAALALQERVRRSL